MTDNKGKYIAGIFMVVLAVASYFMIKNIVPTYDCSGWGWINPLCWSSIGLGIAEGIIAAIVAVWFGFIAVMIFAVPGEKAPWAVMLAIMVPLAIVSWIAPDPIPFIDEAITTLLSGVAGIKVLSGGDGGGQKQLELF